MELMPSLVNLARNENKEPGKSFRKIAEINRMLLNLIPQKKRLKLRFHPLLYYHVARSKLMPELDKMNDPIFNEYADLMMEYSNAQALNQ